VIRRKHFGACSVFVAIVRYHWGDRHAVFQGLPLDGDRAKEIFQHFSFLLLCFVLVNELSVNDERQGNNGYGRVYGNAVAEHHKKLMKYSTLIII
jgi:hypothetical protein